MLQRILFIAGLLLTCSSSAQELWIEVKNSVVAFDETTSDGKRFYAIAIDTVVSDQPLKGLRLLKLLFTYDEALISELSSEPFSKVKIERMREYAFGCPDDYENWGRKYRNGFPGSLFGSYEFVDPGDHGYEGDCEWTTFELYRIVKFK